MPRSFGIGHKSVNIIEQFYDKIECVVILSGQITDWFEVKVGVRIIYYYLFALYL